MKKIYELGVKEEVKCEDKKEDLSPTYEHLDKKICLLEINYHKLINEPNFHLKFKEFQEKIGVSDQTFIKWILLKLGETKKCVSTPNDSSNFEYDSSIFNLSSSDNCDESEESKTENSADSEPESDEIESDEESEISKDSEESSNKEKFDLSDLNRKVSKMNDKIKNLAKIVNSKVECEGMSKQEYKLEEYKQFYNFLSTSVIFLGLFFLIGFSFNIGQMWFECFVGFIKWFINLCFEPAYITPLIIFVLTIKFFKSFAEILIMADKDKYS